MSVRSLFTDSQLDAIHRAVAAAETRTAGEIVAVIAEASDGYDETLWKGATLGALGGAVGAALWAAIAGPWGAGPAWIALPTLIGAGTGTLAARLVGPVRRALAGSDQLARRVAQRAARAFLEEEVFATRERTGILVFLSIFERRVEVLADAGILADVPRETWQQVADQLAAGIRAGRAAETLLESIERCGSLLEEHGPARRPDDRDELSDEVRFRDD